MSVAIRDHVHAPNRFAVIPTAVRLNADPQYTGKGVTIAFLDSGFYPHPDLCEKGNRVLFYKDVTNERVTLDTSDPVESWQWHGTQTSVVAAGDGHLCDGVYKGLASKSQLVLVKVSRNGRITEENIARGIEWIIANRERFNIRVLNISLGGDDDVPCTRSIIDQAAERAISKGIVVVAAAGNSADLRSIPPANSPSVITVGGYHDNNEINGTSLDLYHSNFGPTADGTVKPELVAPAMWVAAPILPGTDLYARAEGLSLLAAAPDVLRELKVVATHYQHVDGTSFAAPIVTSIVAQMLEANPALTPGAIKNILISTADRMAGKSAMRQGFGVVNARRAVELAKDEQHALNVIGCSPPRVQNGHLVFVYHDDEARAVSLVSEFNGWKATPLTKDTTGLWFCEFAAPGPGRYQYKFVVDDVRWIEDPSNGLKVSDGFGGLNSVLVIQ